jgi:hypothetical protein
MAEAYLVTAGTYSEYHVIAGFSTKEKAEEYLSYWVAHGDLGQTWGSKEKPDARVESVPWDPPLRDLVDGRSLYRVRMKNDGEVKEITEQNLPVESPDEEIETSIDSWDHMYTYVRAKDEAHAIKIANERRVQMIANGELGDVRPERSEEEETEGGKE